MKQVIKLYEYNSNMPNLIDTNRDWSKYVAVGYTIQTVIDETLPEYQITLTGTDRKERFRGGMKFIALLYHVMPSGSLIDAEEIHMVVKDDLCERVRMQKKTTYRHTITFTSPSVIPQKAICDNFAVTHRLQEISLKIPLSFNPDTTIEQNTAGFTNQPSTRTPNFEDRSI